MKKDSFRKCLDGREDITLDPLTVLSVAGTITQFVDFGTRLLTANLDDQSAERALIDIRGMIAKLQRPLPVQGKQGASSSAAILEGISRRSLAVANKLSQGLEKPKNKGKFREAKTFQQMINAALGGVEIKALTGELFGIQLSLKSDILVDFR